MADLTEQQLMTQDPEVLGLQRQRALANLLTGQAFNAPQGQMISGRYVKPSNLQQALPMINAAIGGLTNANLDTKEQALATALRGKQMEVAQQYATAKTPQERMAAAMSPYAPQMIKTAFAERMKPQKLGEGETIVSEDFGTGQYAPMAAGGQKIAPEVRQAMQTLGINKPLDQLTPKDLQAIKSEMVQFKQAGANVMNVNMGQHGFDNALKLRSDFRNEPIYKGFEEVRAANNQIQQAAKMGTPAGDLAAATKIMKILDPGSVVRESELGMAMAATGVEDKVRNYANMVITGEKLTPAQRKDFVELGQKLYNVAGEQFNQKRNEYAGIAERNKLDVEAAVGAPADVKKVKLRWNTQTGTFEQ